jgi:hypothetical protein
MGGSSGNGQNPNQHCSDCGNTITVNPDTGMESGHAADCEWNPNKP